MPKLPALAVAFLLVGGVLVPGGALAAMTEPRWSSPQLLARDGAASDVGVAAGGRVVATWLDGAGMTAAERPPRGAFGAPVRVVAASRSPGALGSLTSGSLESNAGDEVAIVYSRLEACSTGFGCPSSIRARLGSSIDRLGAHELVTGHGDRPVAALNESGDLLVSWQTETAASFVRQGAVQVSLRRQGGRFGAPRDLSSSLRGWASSPSVAMNDHGAAVVAWEQESGSASPGGESSIYAAVRTPGRGFGRPELVWRHRRAANGHSAIAAIDRHGDVSVIFEADAKRAAFRPHEGKFKPARRLAAASVTTRVVRDTDDGTVAVWSDPFRPLSYVARARPGGSFGPPATLAGAFWSGAALDSHGNLLVSGVTGPPSQLPFVATYSRYGFAPLELAGPLANVPAGADGLASNDRGAAIATFSLYPPGTYGNSPTPLIAVERPADTAAPRLSVASAKTSRGAFNARVKCTELCRVTGSLRITARAANRSAADQPAATIARVVRRGRHASIRIKLSRRTRTRLRQLLRAGQHPTAQAVLRATDSYGNSRTRRLRATPKKLAR